MRLSKLIAAAAVVVSVAGLSACTSKVGQAALVGGHRISETTVASYLNPQGPTAKALAGISANGGTFQGRSEVVTELVRESLFTQALAKTAKGVPSAAALKKKHDDVAQNQFSSQLTGADFDNELAAQVKALGFRPAFTQLLIKVAELEEVYVGRSGASSSAELLAGLKKLAIRIIISPRYGRWNANQLGLAETPDVGRPDFVSFAPTAPAVAAAPAAG